MSRRPLIAIAIVVASVISPIARSAFADSTSDKQKLDRIAAQLAQMQTQASLLDEQLLQAQAGAAQAQADVTATEAKVVQLQQQLGIVQTQVSELALQQFASGDSGGGLGALLGDPSKLTNAVERDEATKVAFSGGQDSVDQLSAGVDELNKQKATLAQQQKVAQTKASIATSKQNDLTKRTADMTQLQAATVAQYGKDQVAEAQAAQEAALEAQQAKQAAADAAAAQAQAATDRANASKAAAARAASDQAAAAAASAAAAAKASAANQSSGNRGSSNNPAPAPTAGKSGGSVASSGAGATGATGDTGGTGNSGGGAPSNPAPDPAPVAAPPPPASGAAAAVQAALGQLGVPYVFATASPGHSFDCSGLTMWAWSQAGVSLPHQSREQYSMLPRVSQADIQPGDLLFFYNPIHHVAIYVGNGTMVEAPATGLTVRTRPVSWGTVVGIGRP